MGDRGASSLDWAIELGMKEWGVTVLEANGDFDAGDVWATRTFPMRETGKSSLYRHEVRRAAIDALLEAVTKVIAGEAPARLDPDDPRVVGQARALMHQDVRAIDWSADRTDTVVRKIRAAEGHPGVVDEVEGVEFHLFGVAPRARAAGPARPDHRPAPRRDLPGDHRRRRLDHPPQALRQGPRATTSFPPRAPWPRPVAGSMCPRSGHG